MRDLLCCVVFDTGLLYKLYSILGRFPAVYHRLRSDDLHSYFDILHFSHSVCNLCVRLTIPCLCRSCRAVCSSFLNSRCFPGLEMVREEIGVQLPHVKFWR